MKNKAMMQYLSENTNRFLAEDEDDAPVTYPNKDQEDMFGKSGTDDKPKSGKEFQKGSKWGSGQWKVSELSTLLQDSDSFVMFVDDELRDLMDGEAYKYDLELGGFSAITVKEVVQAIDDASESFDFDTSRLYDQLNDMISDEIGDISSATEFLADEIAQGMFANDNDVTEFAEALNNNGDEMNFIDDWGIDITDYYTGLRSSGNRQYGRNY